jgi:long-chain acyl-CoA synthetase
MNVSGVIEDHRDPERIALVHRGEAVSYETLYNLVTDIHAGLVELALAPTDRVVIVAASTPHYIATLLAVLRAGAIAVPLNPTSPPPEMQGELDAVTPALVIVGPAGQANVSGCQIDVPILTLPGAALAGATALEDLLGRAPQPPADEDADDIALLLFTSGTAGSPKPAMLTHGNLLANIEQIQAHATDALSEDDVVLGVVPLFHILGISLFLSAIVRGATLVLVERFDASQTIDLIVQHGVTTISGPPTMWQQWADLPGVDPAAFASVRVAISGAAPLSAELGNRVGERLGIRLRQGYGLTEAAPTLTIAVGTDAPVASVGRPVPGVKIRLVDADGDDVPVGDEGEVWAKGANIFPGYWNDAEATAHALTADGWLRTGDLGVVDDDGYLYLVNRAKDLIVVSGFNVFPAEVEAVVQAHPAVGSVAVVGMPHPSTGEAVKAVVVPAPGAVVDEHELIEFCQSRLARYKCPSAVEVVAALPMGLGGKLRRHELR